MRELICIMCPKGCHLKVDVENDCAVTGNSCERGLAYGRDEVLHPTRVITSTVCLDGGAYRRCPVKLNGVIPKDKIMDAMRTLDGVTLRSPVHRGQVVVPDVCGTGVDFVVTRDL